MSQPGLNGHVPAEQRFALLHEVDPATGCWLWTGRLSHNGYADRIAMGGVRYRPTHYALLAAGRPVPPGMEVDHLCESRSCVNPDHLEAVTRRENELRKYRRRETCPNGHPNTDENRVKVTRKHRDPPYSYDCRECRRAASARHHLARAAQ